MPRKNIYTSECKSCGSLLEAAYGFCPKCGQKAGTEPDKRTYGTGTVIPLEDGKWMLQVSAGSGIAGRRIRLSKRITAKTKREAERELKNFLLEVEKRHNKEKITIHAIIEEYIADHVVDLAPRTQSQYKDTFRRIDSALGKKVAHTLKPKDITTFYRALADPLEKAFEYKKEDGSIGTLSNGLSGVTVLQHHKMLTAAMNWAYKNELVDSRVVDRVEPPECDTLEKRALTDKEIKLFTAALDEQSAMWKCYMMIAIYTGMRRGEISGLRWDCVDLKKGTINIVRTIQDLTARGTEGPPKNRSSTRLIDVPSEVTEALKAWKKQQSINKLKCPVTWPEENYIFTDEIGLTIWLNDCSAKATEIFQSLNIQEASLHSLRHTCVTRLLAAGVPANDVARYVGHASTRMTLDVYGHAADDYSKRCSDAMKTSILATKK